MATLTVGSGLQYTTIAQAVAASHDNDVILIQAGTYKNDFVQINDSITLEAIGGMATLQATVAPSNRKGIITVGDSSHAPNVTLDGLVLAGATIAADAGNNGAGIRYQAGNLILNDDIVRNNQDGLLATPAVASTGTIIVNASTFAANGAGDGQTHNIYVNHVQQFTFENSVSTAAILGHDIKSRAVNTTIVNSTISDGATGTTSYEIDLPNGGNALIEGDTIQQGAHSQNPIIISYGEEGSIIPGSTLVVSSNTIDNDLTAHIPTAVHNATSITASVSGNHYYGLTAAQLTSGPAVLSNNTTLATEPPLTGTPGNGTVNTGGTVSTGGTISTGTAVAPGTVSTGRTGGTLITGGTVNASDAVVQTGTAHATVVVSGSNDDINVGSGGISLTASGASLLVVTKAAVHDTIAFAGSATGTLLSAGQDAITTGAGIVSVAALGADTIQAGTGGVLVTGTAGSASSVSGGAGGFTFVGAGGALTYTGLSGSAYLMPGSGAATIQFGSGLTTLLAGSGKETLVFAHGHDGGNDQIVGFNAALDTLSFQGFSGSAVKSQTVSGGSTLLTLTDNTRITFLNTPSVKLG